MIAKLLATIAFLVVFGVYSWGGSISNRWSVRALSDGRWRFALSGLFVALLLLGYLQFWILTRLFPVYLVLLLVGLSLLTYMITSIIGAIAGFAIEERQHKVSVLSLVWGVQNKSLGCLFLIVMGTYALSAPIASLWVFWKHPVGDPVAVGWIVFFQMLLPQLIIPPLLIAMAWPSVTSEFVDDDVRNSYLTQRLASVFSATIALVYPVWLYREQLGAVFSMPPFWLLLSIPLLALLLGGVFPYFLGMYRFRSQTRLFLEWHRRWLHETLNLVKLPVGQQRSEGLDEQFRDLEQEIEQRLENNRLFKFYSHLLESNRGTEPLALPAAQDVEAQVGTVEVARSADPMNQNGIRLAKAFLKARVAPHATVEQSETVADVEKIITENRHRLVEWDLGFAHVNRLLTFYQVAGESAKTTDLSAYIGNQIEEIDRQLKLLGKKRNVIAAGLVTSLTVVIPWVVKTYQASIEGYIESLVKLSLNH